MAIRLYRECDKRSNSATRIGKMAFFIGVLNDTDPT